MLNPTLYATTTRSCKSQLTSIYAKILTFSSAASWADAKSRVIRAYRRWLRAVCLSFPYRIIRDQSCASVISTAWWPDTVVIWLYWAVLLTLPRYSRRRSKPCIHWICPFQGYEHESDKSLKGIDMSVSCRLLMCYSQNRTWSFRFGSFQWIDNLNNTLTAATGDHELLETIITCFEILFSGRGRGDKIATKFHERLPRGMSKMWLLPCQL